jgi:hypothetical protein
MQIKKYFRAYLAIRGLYAITAVFGLNKNYFQIWRVRPSDFSPNFFIKIILVSVSVARFFSAAVGLERGPLSLVNNLRSYLEEIVAAPGLENRSYNRKDSMR